MAKKHREGKKGKKPDNRPARKRYNAENRHYTNRKRRLEKHLAHFLKIGSPKAVKEIEGALNRLEARQHAIP